MFLKRSLTRRLNERPPASSPPSPPTPSSTSTAPSHLYQVRRTLRNLLFPTLSPSGRKRISIAVSSTRTWSEPSVFPSRFFLTSSLHYSLHRPGHLSSHSNHLHQARHLRKTSPCCSTNGSPRLLRLARVYRLILLVF